MSPICHPLDTTCHHCCLANSGSGSPQRMIFTVLHLYCCLDCNHCSNLDPVDQESVVLDIHESDVQVVLFGNVGIGTLGNVVCCGMVGDICNISFVFKAILWKPVCMKSTRLIWMEVVKVRDDPSFGRKINKLIITQTRA